MREPDAHAWNSLQAHALMLAKRVDELEAAQEVRVSILGSWPKKFKRARQLDAVVDRYEEGQSFKQPHEDVAFLIDCLDNANRRIENLLSLLARERSKA